LSSGTEGLMRVFVLGAMATLGAFSWSQVKAVPILIGGQDEVSKTHGGVNSAKSARRLLIASMARRPQRNVRAIILQREDYTSSVMQQIKVEMGRDGRLHQIVLAPLSVQGFETVDNGTVCRTFCPDEHCVIEQPSARQEGDDVPFRMGLAERNYTFSIDHQERIAGRPATVVAAVPHYADLETRFYSIDDETGFLLRLQTSREGGPTMLHFETKMVEFPTDFSEGTFHLEPALGVMTRRFEGKCVSPGAAHRLQEELGFEPVIPSNLPLGFTAKELQASSESKVPSLAVRITDGLAKATVIEWAKKGRPTGQVPAGTKVMNAGGLTLLISGDLSDAVKERLLRSFIQAGRRERAESSGSEFTTHYTSEIGACWALELVCEVNAFNFDRDF